MARGFTQTVPSVLLFVFYALSLALMTVAVKRIDMSVAYAIGSGVGTAAIGPIGVFWFREALAGIQIGSIVLIVAGVIGLRAGGAA